MSEASAVTNFSGNAVATLLIGHWTGELDRVQADRVLSGDDPFDEATMLDDDHGHGSDRAAAADSRVAAEPTGTDAVGQVPDPYPVGSGSRTS
jgi:aerobic C4-dicarboxylate transport protein